METELERLIAEQRRDMAMGEYQDPEPAAGLSLDIPGGEGAETLSLQELVDEEGKLPYQNYRYRSRHDACPVHGWDSVVMVERLLQYMCKQCQAEYNHTYYLTHKSQYLAKKKREREARRKERMLESLANPTYCSWCGTQMPLNARRNAVYCSRDCRLQQQYLREKEKRANAAKGR